MELALRPSSFEFAYNASNLIKRDLLYFEQVHICSFTDHNIFNDLKDFDPEYLEKLQKDLRLVQDNHLVHEFRFSEVMSFIVNNKVADERLIPILERVMKMPKPLSKIKFKGKFNEFKARQLEQEYFESIDNSENEVTRLSSILLNEFSAKDQAVALLPTDILTNSVGKSNVLEVVLSKIPIPDENLSWEKIIEYRKDSDTQAKFQAIRVWMQDISRQDYSAKEISERLDHLMHEYESHLEFHKLKYSHGKMRIFITTIAEIAENLATLKFGKLAETAFSIFDKNLELFEAEMQAPGREVAYISKARKFS